jgi:hypothetical protein
LSVKTVAIVLFPAEPHDDLLFDSIRGRNGNGTIGARIISVPANRVVVWSASCGLIVPASPALVTALTVSFDPLRLGTVWFGASHILAVDGANGTAAQIVLGGNSSRGTLVTGDTLAIRTRRARGAAISVSVDHFRTGWAQYGWASNLLAR